MSMEIGLGLVVLLLVILLAVVIHLRHWRADRKKFMRDINTTIQMRREKRAWENARPKDEGYRVGTPHDGPNYTARSRRL